MKSGRYVLIAPKNSEYEGGNFICLRTLLTIIFWFSAEQNQATNTQLLKIISIIKTLNNKEDKKK